MMSIMLLKYRVILHVMASALLLLCAFMLPSLSILCGCIFLIPLFNGRLQPWHGLLWGTLVFGIHCFWLLLLFCENGFGLLGYTLCIALIAWLSCLTALWFSFLPKYPVISTMLFFTCIQKYCLCIIGQCAGYPLFNLWLPVADIVLPIVPFGQILQYLYLTALVFWQWLASRWIASAKWKRLVVLCFCVLLCVLQTKLHNTKHQLPMMDLQAGVIVPWWHKSKDGMFAAYRMAYDLTKLYEQQTQIKTIILPESSFAWNVYEYEQMWSVWSENLPNVTIIFGGYDENSHNCLFFLHNGQMLQKHSKAFLMPILEQPLLEQPPMWSRRKREQVMDSDKHVSSDEYEIDGQMYQFFVCSELFFEKKLITQTRIIVVWNDSWLYFDWIKRLARMYLWYFACKHHVELYHVSTLGHHNFCCCLS